MREQSYTAGQVATRTGISVRALHHYESLGLLSPERGANGYRRYGAADLDRLEQVLLYRACGMALGDIRELLDSPHFDVLTALRQQLQTLSQRRDALDALMRNVRTTIETIEREQQMSEQSRFETLRNAALAANERTFGAEARRRHGDEAIDAANERLMGMSETEWNDMNELEQGIIEQLKCAMASGNPTGPEAEKLAAMHARWISLHWAHGAYTPEAHLGLARGYLANEQFRSYYDSRAGDGATTFLVRALEAALDA